MPEDKIKKYYQYLDSKGEDLPNEEKFREVLSNPEKADKYYDYLKGKGLDVPESKESFYNTFNVKKKEDAEVVGETSSEVGPSEEGELMSTLKGDTTTEPQQIEVPQEDLAKPERKEVAGDVLTPQELDPKLAKEIEEKLPDAFAKQTAKREARLIANREIVDTMLPEIDSRLNAVEGEYNKFISEEIGWGIKSKDEVDANRKQVEILGKQMTYLKDARDILKKADRYAETSDAGVFESMFKGTLGKDFFTMGITELTRDVDVLKVAKKLEAGESTTEAENMALYAYGLKQQLEGDVDPSVASMIGSGVRESIPFMVQLALTSPIGNASKKAAEAGVKKIIKNATKKELNKYAVKAIGGLTRAGVQTLGQTEFYKGGIREQIGVVTPEKGQSTYAVNIDPATQKSAAQAFGKSYAKTFGTVLIERAGGEASRLLNRTSKKVGVTNIPDSWMKRAVKNIEDATGFDDFLAETGEELLDGYKEAVFEGEYNPLKAFTGKEMLAMIGSVGIMRGTMSGAAMIQNPSAKDRVQSVQSLREAETKLKPQTIADLDRIQQGDDMKKNAEQLDIYLKQKKADGATDEDILKVVDYVAQKIRMDALAEGEQTIVEGRAEQIEPVKTEEKAKEVAKPQVEKEVAETALKIEEVEQKPKEDEKEKVQKEVIVETDEKGKQETVEDEGLKEEQGLLKETKPFQQFENLVEESETPQEFSEKAKKIKDVPPEVAQQFYDEYGEGGKLSMDEAAENFYQKTKTDAGEIETKIEEPSPEKGIEGKEGEGLRMGDAQKAREAEVEKEVKTPKPPPESRVALESRVSKSVTRIGDVTKKKPNKLVKEAKSMAELDYIYDLHKNEIPFKEYNEKKAKLRDKNKLDDDLNRIADIQDQVLFSKAKEVDQALEDKLGKDKFAELKSKRSAEVDKLVNSIGNLANIKKAVGDGKKLDVGKEFVQVAKSLTNIGLISVELGTRQAMDSLRKFISEHAPGREFDLDKHENLIARELGTREYDKKAAESDPEALDRETQEMIEADKKIEEEIVQTRKKTMKNTLHRMIIKGAPFRTALTGIDDRLAKRAKDAFNTMGGMSGKSEGEFNKARKKVLGGFKTMLDTNEKKALESYIEYKRIIELDKLYDKRGDNRLLHTGGLNLEKAEVKLDRLMNNLPAALESHGIKKDIDWKKVDQRAQAYWDSMQNKLTDIYEAGLITEEVYKKLKDEQPHYSPRQYKENIIEKVDGGGSVSGIEALSGGSMGSTIKDIQTLLADNIARANSAIARNEMFQKMHDLAVGSENDIVKPAQYTQTRVVDGKKKLGYIDKLKKEEKRLEDLRIKLEDEGRSETEINQYIEAEKRYIEPTFEGAPTGYQTYKFKSEGKDKAVYIDSDYADDVDPKSDPKWLNYLGRAIGIGTGTKLLKAAATGYNPEFAVKNVPLDMMNILTTTEHYNTFYPLGTAQLLQDMAIVAKDAALRTGRFKDFVDEGGSLDYLATQTALTSAKFKAYNKFTVGAKAVADAASYVQNTSEILTRLALRERVIKNLTKQFQKDNEGRLPNKSELKEIQKEASAEARAYIDYAQAGSAMKLMNNAIPYLNAGFQVTRGALRAAKRNPKVFAKKMGQLMGTAGILTMHNLGVFSKLFGNGEDDDEAKERRQFYLNDISDRAKTDNFIVMTKINYVDNQGNKRYLYFSFPKDNVQKFITGVAEGSILEAYGQQGELLSKRRIDELQSLAKNITDIGNLPPVGAAYFGTKLNKNLYYNQDLWLGKDYGEDRSQEYIPGRTPQRFVKFGEISEKAYAVVGKEKSFSPIRTEYFVQQLLTGSNLIGSALGKGLDLAVGDIGEEEKNLVNKSTAELLKSSPFLRRFLKETSPFSKESPAKKETQRLNVQQAKNDRIIKPLLKEKEYIEAINFLAKEKDLFEMQRMAKMVKNELAKVEGVSKQVKDLSFAPPKARARAYYTMWKKEDKKGRARLFTESAMLKFFDNDEFRFEIAEIQKTDPDFSLTFSK